MSNKLEVPKDFVFDFSNFNILCAMKHLLTIKFVKENQIFQYLDDEIKRIVLFPREDDYEKYIKPLILENMFSEQELEEYAKEENKEEWKEFEEDFKKEKEEVKKCLELKIKSQKSSKENDELLEEIEEIQI